MRAILAAAAVAGIIASVVLALDDAQQRRLLESEISYSQDGYDQTTTLRHFAQDDVLGVSRDEPRAYVLLSSARIPADELGTCQSLARAYVTTYWSGGCFVLELRGGGQFVSPGSHLFPPSYSLRKRGQR